jgi:membrane protein
MGACGKLCTSARGAASAGICGAPISHVRARTFLRDLGRHFVDDNILNAGAMMAYYSVLALFPMLVLVVALAMLVIPAAAVQQGVQMASAAVPPAVRAPLVGRIHTFMHQSHGTFALVGAALALFSARSGLTSMMQALNVMFHKRETRSWLRRQVIAILLAISVALLIVLALGLLVVGPIVGRWITDRTGLGAAVNVVWAIGRWVGAGLLVMIVWAMVYKFLPDTDAPFRIFTPGAIVGVMLWLAASYGFGVYLDHFNRYETTYGALGGAIIFLNWLWLSNIALFVGAEINAAVADTRKQTAAVNRAPVPAVDEHDIPGRPKVSVGV